jgi:hypothetical protein
MKWLPGSLLALTSIGFFVAASFGHSVGVYVSVGVLFLIISLVMLRRAQSAT